MKVIENISYSNIGHPRQVLDLYLPECDEFPVFIYFHGGGIVKGNKSCVEKSMAKELTDRGIAVVSANYRLYPSAVYPDFLRDAASAVAWVFGNIENYGKAKGVYVGGSSAGGYISMMLCFDKKYLGIHRLSPMDIAGFVHDAGQPTAHFNVLRERGIDSRRVIIDESAPIYHIGVEKEYPPMLFLVATDDMENRYEQTVLTVSTLKHFGYDMSKVELKVLEGTHTNYKDFALWELVHEYIKKEK